MITPIYLDFNGTTPLDPAVIKAMYPFLETHFGNPSSSHWYGIVPKQAVTKAREQVAGLLNCQPQEVLFTSGGTESNNHAIIGISRLLADKGRHIITSRVEHPAVLEVCRFLETRGFAVTYLPVNETGRVITDTVEAAIRPDTVLISIMHANNEVGTVQPIGEIAGIAARHKILMHTDAAQSAGKIPVQVDELGVDLLSLAGHKLYAPKGIGALYIRDGIDLPSFCHGADQEYGRRAGTENVSSIVGLGAACEIAAKQRETDAVHMATLRDKLQAGIEDAVQAVRINGHPTDRLPNTLSVAFADHTADRVLETIGLHVSASAGAACHSDAITISHVLTAMGIPEKWAHGTLRFSVGRMTTHNEIDAALPVIIDAVSTPGH
ncbi:MAG: cysteine desulfurase family protein [Thermodesulfobacteriota bacterium]|nr:cysteine desulfurase family protein [Thermodesulfobacteriota bacterium]